MQGGVGKHFGCALVEGRSIQVSDSVASYCLLPKSALQIFTSKFSPEFDCPGQSGARCDDARRFCWIEGLKNAEKSI